MDIVLIAGLWLKESIWDQVADALSAVGHRPVAVSTAGATLDDQLAAVVAAIDAAAESPFVIGHSAACSLAWLAADRRPERVAKVGLIGGFPSGDGVAYADFDFPRVDGAMPFPGWEPFEGPDAADLSPEARRNFEADAIAVPNAVAGGIVQLTDPRRFDVPVLVICPEFTPAQAQEWIAAGDAPELAAAKHVEFVDIDSGHWPMITQPAVLAQIIATAAT